ncbi:MAG TPA: peptidase M28, partial [Thermoanaerobaculia bacterium]|nr:peptidase M28 [Thermoanaerobaculia bacterium]
MTVAAVLVASAGLGQSVPQSIIDRELAASRAYETLERLTDDIGPRLSGSPNAAAAVTWALRTFDKWGISAAPEKVIVPHWVRGAETATLVSHRNQRVDLTALGGSVATPPAGLTADVVEVDSFDALKSANVKGKIVFYDVPMDMDMVRAHRSFDAYSKAVVFRSDGPSKAAEFGAVAV